MHYTKLPNHQEQIMNGNCTKINLSLKMILKIFSS